jgi:hypothetical protein
VLQTLLPELDQEPMVNMSFISPPKQQQQQQQQPELPADAFWEETKLKQPDAYPVLDVRDEALPPQGEFRAFMPPSPAMAAPKEATREAFLEAVSPELRDEMDTAFKAAFITLSTSDPCHPYAWISDTTPLDRA